MESDRKPVIFIGSSSEARDFAEALQINLDGVAEPIPWTQVDFELSRSTLDTLESELDRADFAAFVFAPDDETRIRGEQLRTTRDNVLIELGLFIGRLGRSRTFIVLATGTEEKLRMPTDLLGLTAATYDYRSYDPQRRNARAVMGAASFEIRNAIQRLGARRQTANEPRRRVKGVLERGSTEVITNFADSGIYVADNRHEYPQELKRRLRNGELVPMKYLYWTPQGSAHWLAICQQGSYTFYRNSVALLREKAYELVDNIVKSAGRPDIDFISVGSGDGIKDNILFRVLGARLQSHEFAYYYPLDISDALIVQAITGALGAGVPRPKFRVKALIADFAQLHALQRFYEERPANNVFSVLGNTVGNADEVGIMRAVADAMFDGDLVLFEVNTGEAQEDDPMLRERVNMEHDFTPLASLNVMFEPDKMTYSLATGQSVVPGTKSILATYAAAEIDGVTVPDIKLSIVHHYELTAFQKSIEEKMNLHTVVCFERNGVGLILARR